MIFKIITYSKWKRFWSRENTWLQSLFQSVKDKIDAIVIPDPDLSALAQRTDVKDGDDTTIGMLKDVATDAEIYAMFPGAVDENGNINGYWIINEAGYLMADFAINNGIITLN